MKRPTFRLSKPFADIEEEFLEEVRKEEALKKAQQKPESKFTLGTSSSSQ